MLDFPKQQEGNLITRSKPVLIEGAFIIAIGFLLVGNTTITDIVFHDNYVLPAIGTCYPENQEAFCVDIRKRMGLVPTAHLEIGDFYWNELARQAVFIGVIMFAIRMGIGAFLQIQQLRRIRLSTILMAVTWGVVGSGLFLFGFVDTLYYVFQGEDAPDTLAWLNSAGIFEQTREFTGDPNLVEIEDLYLTNILGILVIGAFLFVTMVAYANSGMSNRGIA